MTKIKMKRKEKKAAKFKKKKKKKKKKRSRIRTGTKSIPSSSPYPLRHVAIYHPVSNKVYKVGSRWQSINWFGPVCCDPLSTIAEMLFLDESLEFCLFASNISMCVECATNLSLFTTMKQIFSDATLPKRAETFSYTLFRVRPRDDSLCHF